MTLLRPASFASRGPANGRDIVVAMAAHLRKVGIPETEREAIRLLAAGGFRYGDVAVLAEDALLEARQSAVSDAMTGTPPLLLPAKASQAPPSETVLAAPGSAGSSGLLSMLALEAPLSWRAPDTGA
ncbi:hypothetical protein [Bradyrhizobium cytisi]|uniref:Uncharacterized protein n=1 Tax=Bradyrhizobium cytisi TaxID=515489 RepID=A0A5S4WD20_9BRAD|nr:hypothetical protein [Bradyrhizobium cytisi]TYL80151.1 hypothetical protein FXB38_24600 [Bradyrhizobium cytisi]